MSLMGVVEAAEELGVSPRRVRQMLAEGNLRGERVGRAWVVEHEALERVAAKRPEVGRPWRAEAAWAFLALADGREIDVSPVDRVRLRRRLEDGVRANLGRLRARSDEHRVYGHPSVLQPILDLPNVVRSGVSAAADYSIDVIAQDVAEAYVRSSEVSDLVEGFALDESSDRPNLILRVVDDDAWPFDVGDEVAPSIVAAVDLLEADDERSRRAGVDLLERL
ncbi:MAG: helix-turn-helix domain-containing protein [Sulfitobacter sp.]|nr:helix-turn-helix domain-containing protein [Sulfitobacter sp.]